MKDQRKPAVRPAPTTGPRRFGALPWLVAALAVLLSGCRGPAPQTGGQPNVVLVIVDTLRRDHLGCYGAGPDASPELDGFARLGVRFDHVVAQSTWTRPSIGSLLTSLHPRSIGIYKEQEQVLADRFTTLAERFRDAGYTTVGLTANPNINSYFNFDQGFDRYVDTEVVFGWMPAESGRHRLGVDNHWLPRASELLARAREETAQHGAPPYFLQINLMDVHQFDGRPQPPPFDRMFGEQASARVRSYRQAVRFTSHAVHRFVRQLSESREWSDTIFVFTSDHGETLTDHPGLSHPKHHGWLVYESQSLVPLILYSTENRLPRGRVIEQPVRLLDLMPTLLELAGIPVPEGLAGASLVAALGERSAELSLPDAFVVETRFQTADKIALYTPTWKYIENRDRHAGSNPRELFPIGSAENGMRNDLSAQEPSLLEQLARLLARWEIAHPEAEPTLAAQPPTPQVEDQLRALGYLD